VQVYHACGPINHTYYHYYDQNRSLSLRTMTRMKFLNSIRPIGVDAFARINEKCDQRGASMLVGHSQRLQMNRTETIRIVSLDD